MANTEARNLHHAAIIARTNALSDTVGTTGRAATAAWKRLDAAANEVDHTARLVEQAVRREMGSAPERSIMRAALGHTA